DVLPEESKRPEVKKNITTHIKYDYANRPIVNIDEKNISRFTVYDRSGRERFYIDGDGYIIEHQYTDSFTNPTKIIQHSVAINKDVILANINGFSLDTMLTLISELDKKDDRTVTLTYDRRGLKKSAEKDKIITPVINGEKIKAAEASPRTSWDYNAFGNIIKETTLINANNESAATRNFHDNNGNLILTISPKGYVTTQLFGMHVRDTNSNEHILLNRIEFELPLSAEINWDNYNAVLKSIQKHAKDVITDFKYDRRLLQTTKTVTSGDMFYKSTVDANDQPIVNPDTNSITTGTEYDADGRVSAYISETNEKRYLVRNKRGDVIYETNFPLVTDLNDKDENGISKKQIALTQHLINAHGQKTGSIQFVNPASVVLDKNKKLLNIIQPVKPDEQSEQDHETLLLMDNRGNNTVTQTPENHLKNTTFNEKNEPTRKYHTVTGYQVINNVLTPVTHIHAIRMKLDNRKHIIMHAVADEKSETQTHKKINAFSEVVGEGPTADNMILIRVFDKSGYKWFTNEDNGIATISFPNADGSTVVTFRAPDMNLAHYSDNQEAAKNELLDVDYEKTFKDVQRTVLERDLEDNVQTQQLAWYRTKPKDIPECHQMSFRVIQEASKTYITWHASDERLLEHIFKLRVKGTEAWEELQPIRLNNETYAVDITSKQTNCYEYELDYYFNDPEKGVPDHTPSYRSVGETMLDTGNYENANSLVWYMQDQQTLILCGKLDDVTGIELLKNGQPYKRLAGTKIAPGKMSIDFADEFSGDYEFKAIKGMRVLQENISPGVPSSPFNLKFYYPFFHFVDQDHFTNFEGSLPPEITSLEVVYKVAAAPVPAFTYGCFEKNNYKLDIPAGASLPGMLVYGRDNAQNKYFLGYFVSTTNDTVNSGKYTFITNNYFAGIHVTLPTYVGTSFYVLNNASADQPHALVVNNGLATNGTFQLYPWSGSAYKWKTPGLRASNLVQASVVTLKDAAVTEVLGQLPIRTKNHTDVMTAREINVTDLYVKNYKITGFDFDERNNDSWRNYYNYEWNTNLSSDNRLLVTHEGEQFEINDLKALPKEPGNGVLNPKNFQRYSPRHPEAGPSAGPMGLSVVTDEGDIIDMGVITPRIISKDGGRTSVVFFDVNIKYDGEFIEESKYPDSYALYFSPVPANLGIIKFQYLTKTTLNQPVWRELPINKTGLGFSVNVTGVNPGDYHYRIFDQNNYPVNLTSVGVEYNNDSHGVIKITNNKPGNMTFISKNKDQILKLVKPVVKAKYNRRHNRTQVTNRSGQTTDSEFNFLNTEIKTTTPETTISGAHNEKTRERLVTENLVNTHGCSVAVVHPNGGKSIRVVNDADSPLKTADADGVTASFTMDLLKRKTSVQGMTGGKRKIKYRTKNKRKHQMTSLPGNRSEEVETNEENCVIRKQDALNRNVGFDFDVNRRETLHINPKFNTRAQAYHPRSGIPLFLKDVDGNEQSWSTESSNPSDDYFGIARSHTDFARQKIL
ncbi:MAG: hypothetical protein P4M12_02550, partial [Gammaproteobacteria bacterium]|nr:hypothetical protein [Gammaproteobacteria bacterium]